jgi:glycosyltransferase involved in cell wall biosynthesis
MRLALVDFVPWDYTAETPYARPLGGSQSAMCYLGAALAAAGVEVYLVNGAERVGVARGVTTLPVGKAGGEFWRSVDVAVVQNWGAGGVQLRPHLSPAARLLFWTQHAHDQPAVRVLADGAARRAYDAVVYVSDWQRSSYERRLGTGDRPGRVLRNGIGPAFAGLFAEGENVLAPRAGSPVLAYTSTPFRGLEVLLEVFPRLRAARPELRLEVYSSMQVYQVGAEEDARRYGELYRRCRATVGVEYVGSLPQPELALRLRGVRLLAYPNTFAETSCIAVREALAAGCRVVSSALGALAETGEGWARLVSMAGDRADYADRFVAEVLECLAEDEADPERAEEALRRQVDAVTAGSRWEALAQEWLEELQGAASRRAG